MKRVQFIKVFGLGSQYSDAAPELNAYMAKNPDHMIKTMTGNEGLLVVCFEQEVLPKHSEEPPHDRLFDKYEGKRRAVVNALRAAGVPPVGDNDPWTVIMMLMAWSTGPGGVAAHVRHFARAIAGVSGERRWGALIRAAFEAAERGTVPARMPHNHRLNPYYSLIRGMQKVEVGRRLIQATGGNVAFLDDGLGTDRQTVYDKLAHMAYVQQPEDAARRGRVSMVGTQGVTPPPPAGVSPAHNNDDPVTAEADSRQTPATAPPTSSSRVPTSTSSSANCATSKIASPLSRS
jgi:hypothetical protein